jgi:serine/threonine-protein kinase RsbW
VKTLQLKIKSKTDKLYFVRDFVSDAARNFGFDEEAVSKIALAVDEACTNIIKHSYNYAPNKELDVRIITNEKVFEVVITHQGKLFDPSAIHAPNMQEYLSSYRRGGLGMHLMKLLMDKVDYKILPNQTCEVHLVKLITKKNEN